MKSILPVLSSHFISRMVIIAACAFVSVNMLSPIVTAQVSRTTTDGFTPADVAPGAPAGSYALNGFDTVNLFNGKVNFHLPLVSVGGRGDAKFTLSLPIEQRWSVIRQYYQFGVFQDVAEGLGSRMDQIRFTPGYLVGENTASEFYSGLDCNGSQTYFTSLHTRLRFYSPDGTEYLLHDKDPLRNGLPSPTVNLCNNPSPTFSRGKIFVTDDGESMTFISDAPISDIYAGYSHPFYPSGYLLFSDGSRYRIVSGSIVWMRDRNGNKMSFTNGPYGVTSITDSLNRQITVSYGNASNPVDIITYSGVNGNVRQIKIWYSSMQAALRPDCQIKNLNELFPEYPAQVNTPYNPIVISSVELPDSRKYQLYYNSYGELARVILPTGGGVDYQISGENASGSGAGDLIIVRRLTKRITYNSLNPAVHPDFPPGGTVEKIESYSVTRSTGNSNWRAITVQQKRGNDAAIITQERHTYYDANEFVCDTTSSPPWWEGKEYKTEMYSVINGVPGPVNQMIDQLWFPYTSGGGSGCYSGPAPNPKIVETKTSLVEASQVLVSKQSSINPSTGAISFDQYNNRTDLWEYDYGISSPGSLIRHSQTIYKQAGYDAILPSNSSPDPLLTLHLRRLIDEQRVFDANGVERSRVKYFYDDDKDEGVANPLGGLAPRSGITGIASRTGQAAPAYEPESDLKRGNIVQVNRWLLASTGPAGSDEKLKTYSKYDVAGNIVTARDAKGNNTQYVYDDAYCVNASCSGTTSYSTYAYLTRILLPVSSAYDVNGLSTQYDYYTGKPVKSSDANNKVTTIEYNDTLDRITRVIPPAGGSEIIYEYGFGDSTGNRYIRTRTKQQQTFPITWLEDYVIYDGLGRNWRSAHYEGTIAGSTRWSVKDLEFDSLGRVYRTANPYYLDTSAITEPPTGISSGSALWSTTAYDALGRVISVTTPDGSAISTVYLGNRITVTDQQGKQRSSTTDALGRLIQVNEAPNSSGYNYQTNYTYDVLGNLTLVRQGGFPTPGNPDQNVQFRRFHYDSLSRLVYASNPEQDATISYAPPGQSAAQWNMKYEYDLNGNLWKRTDARGLLTEYEYDALNRNTKVKYPAGNGSYEVRRSYDMATNGKGRLWRTECDNLDPRPGVGVAYSQTVVNAYDNVGRVTSQTQRFAQGLPASASWREYTSTRSYDLVGHVLTQGYPSGRSATYNYTGAGRLNSFSGSIGDGVSRDYASESQYNPAGLMTRETFGTTNTVLYHGMGYNSRYQMVETTLGTNVTEQGTWTRGRLWFFYNSTAESQNNPYAEGPGNNGNVLRQEHHVPTAVTEKPGQMALSGVTTYSIPMRDRYTYDPLNRLLRVNGFQVDGTSPEAAIYSQGYLYDKFGNRKIDLANTSGNAINKKVYNPLPASNRLRELYYDAAGNVMGESDPGAPADPYTYDVENKMIRAFAGGVNNYYIYDGDGRRVRRIASGVEYWQVYGIDGELLDEYKIVSGAPESTPEKEYGYRNGQMLIVGSREGAQTKILWHVMDHLGTPRIQADQTGALVNIKRHDYLPFGEELFVGIGGYLSTPIRSAGMGYTLSLNDDKVRQRFTGQERDWESNLDYFEARYYSQFQARFLSVDPFNPVQFFGDNALTRQYLLDPQQWNRYSYANNNPLTYIDRDGMNPLIVVGAVAGALFGAGYEILKQTYEIRTGKRGEYNVIKIGATALSGAIGGAAAGATGGLSLAGQLAVSSTASAVGGIVERSIDNDAETEAFDPKDVILDTIGVIPGGVRGGAFGDAVEGLVLNSSTYKAALKTIQGELRRIRNRSMSRTAGARNAYFELLQYAGKTKLRAEEGYGKIVEELTKTFLERTIFQDVPKQNPCGVKPGSGDGCGIPSPPKPEK